MKPIFSFSALVGSALSLLSSAGSQAAVLANYDFTANASSVDTDTSSTAANFGSTYGSQSGYSSSGNYFVRVQATPDALDTTRYLSFTVAATAGNVLNLTSLDFRSALSSNNTTAFSGGLIVRSSADGYATDVATYTFNSTNTAVFTQRAPIDLTGSQYQNRSTITFRFYVYDTTDSEESNAIVHRIDDVVLSGSAIPESGSTAVLGLAGAGMFLRRRR